MNKVVINDTANVFWKRKSDGHIVFTTEAQLASISQAVSEERLLGGIGNKTIAILSTEKNIDLTVRNSLWDMDYLSMTQGIAIQEEGEATIKRSEVLTVTDNAGSLEVTITGTPLDNTAVLFDTDGSQEEVAVTTSTIELPVGATAQVGDKVTVVYDESITGDIVTFDSQTFSENYEVEFQTIAYSPETMEVVQDIIIQFDQVKPSGNFEMSFENGTALTPELNFMVLAETGGTEMGRIIRKNR